MSAQCEFIKKQKQIPLGEPLNKLIGNLYFKIKVLILNKTLLNVFSNYVPNKIVTFNDKDPPWMKQYLKSQINWRNNVYQE